MAEQPNIFGYMRIGTQEERQKQRYNRQEDALNKYASAIRLEQKYCQEVCGYYAGETV